MFEILNYASNPSLLAKFLSRKEVLDDATEKTVKDIIAAVRTNGDKALRHYTKKFDGVTLASLAVSDAERNKALRAADKKFIRILEQAALNIFRFHEQELDKSFFYDAGNGTTLGQKVTPIEKAGLYVPGGTASYPSSVLMNAIPALVAGVPEIYLTTPADKHGMVGKNILVAADVLGLRNIFKVGGAQAIAAFAFGTETFPKVYKITGPGNKFVATAKRLVFGDVSIDSIAGPSEILVIADETANAEFIVHDLFSQAEHDAHASAILVTPSKKLALKVEAITKKLLPAMKRKNIIEAAISNHSAIVLVEDLNEACKVSNIIAPEHLEVQTENPWDLLPHLRNAGAIFLGESSTEPVGDYFAGPNHTLPTSSTAHFFSALSTKDFLKRTSIISYSKESLARHGSDIAAFADAEGLDAHAAAIRVRLSTQTSKRRSR
jgi:histidinol dehydrogenase